MRESMSRAQHSVWKIVKFVLTSPAIFSYLALLQQHVCGYIINDTHF